MRFLTASFSRAALFALAVTGGAACVIGPKQDDPLTPEVAADAGATDTGTMVADPDTNPSLERDAGTANDDGALGPDDGGPADADCDGAPCGDSGAVDAVIDVPLDIATDGLTDSRVETTEPADAIEGG